MPFHLVTPDLTFCMGSPASIRNPCRQVVSYNDSAKIDESKETYRLESGDLGVVIGRSIVDGHSADFTVKEAVRDLRDAFEAAIAGPEIEVRRPVVGEVLGEAAGSAVGNLCDI